MSALNRPCSPPRVPPLLLPSPALGWGPRQGAGLPGGSVLARHRPAGRMTRISHAVAHMCSRSCSGTAVQSSVPPLPRKEMPGVHPGSPAPLSPVAGLFWLSQGSRGAGCGRGDRSRLVQGGCRDLRGWIMIARSIVELGAASPPLCRFSPLNAEQMARVLQSEMSLSCLKSN